MSDNGYIRIYKEEQEIISNSFKVSTYEFYFSSIANCARWLGVSYNAVKKCLKGEYNFCKGYRITSVKKKPDERDYFLDPDKYRNPSLRYKEGVYERRDFGRLSCREKWLHR